VGWVDTIKVATMQQQPSCFLRCTKWNVSSTCSWTDDAWIHWYNNNNEYEY